MSWIIGIKGNSGDTLNNKITTLLPSKYIQVKTNDLEVFCGGLSETSCFQKTTDDSHGFFVCGIGIKTENDHTKFMDSDDWQNIITKNVEDVRKLNGHFTGIRWDTNCTTLFTDVLGLREMYITKLAGVILFSTRLNWLSQLSGECHIDFEQFGAVWHCFNQLSHRSFIRNIERLEPGSLVFLENNNVRYNRESWLPDTSKQSSADLVIKKIKKFTLFPLYNNHKISLGLSGGIDSRVLLKILSSQENKNWDLHTFGDPNHPDALVAKDISNKLNLDLTILDDMLPPVDKCVQIIKNHFGQNTVHVPASEIMRLRWYTPLYEQKKIVVDGGFGEIARRQYLNRLLIEGRNTLIQKDAEAISKYLRHHRADIFNSDADNKMNRGYINQINCFLESMPDINTYGMENWLDLLAIRFRLANWFGFAQACVDGLSLSYMPFAQKELLNEVIKLPIKLRKNGRLWRKIIRDTHPNLTKFPLIKGSISYPFRLSMMGAMFWTSAKRKLGMYYRDLESVVFIDHLKEFIQDVVHSEDVKSYPHYDYTVIKEMVDRYFSGEKQHARKIDWWLAFEIWRKSL